MNDIIENNKLIANFRKSDYNSEIVSICQDLYDKGFRSIEIIDNKEPLFEYPHYHSDWNWLMPVVEKIESLGYDVIINGEWCNINSVELEDDICDISIKGKINAVYLAIVEFIKWHNENKNE